MKKAAANADVVIVTMHAGAEGADRTHVPPGTETYLGENRGNVVAFSHAVVDSGADVVIGHGPHVLRGMEWYKGRLIAYSLGNFAGYKVFALGGPLSLSGILRVTLRGDGGFDSGTLVPTRLVGAGSAGARPGRERPRDRANALPAGLRRTGRQGVGERQSHALVTLGRDRRLAREVTLRREDSVREFDVVVIGAGVGGEVAAGRLG